MPASPRSGLSRRHVLWVKLALAGVEFVAGAVIFAAGLAGTDLAVPIRRMALRELGQDPGDFIARHILSSLHALQPHHAVVLGAFVALYALCKAGLVVSVLRRHKVLTAIGAIAFGVIALSGVGVLISHPTPLRVLLAILDVVVLVVVALEARATLARS